MIRVAIVLLGSIEGGDISEGGEMKGQVWNIVSTINQS